MSPWKKYGFRFVAVFLIVAGGAAFLIAPNSFAIRSLGVAGILAGAWLIRVAGRGDTANGAGTGTSRRLGLGASAAGAGSLVAAGASYLLLRHDALSGYHQLLPVFLFASVGLACAVIWGYIAVKLLQ